jgi:hypothetical protein
MGLGYGGMLRRLTNGLGCLLERWRVPVYVRDGLATVHDHAFLRDPRFRAAYARGVQACGGADYQLPWRLEIALWCGRQAITISGDFMECGVNRGFMSSALMLDLEWETRGRTFWLIDSFTGIDVTRLTDGERLAGREAYNRKSLGSGFYATGPDEVVGNFGEWPHANVVQGMLPECLAGLPLGALAFVHMDLNAVGPELQTLDLLWPRISGGGIVLVDDYGFFGFPAHKPAYDAFAAARGIEVLQLPTGQGIIVKPPA